MPRYRKKTQGNKKVKDVYKPTSSNRVKPKISYTATRGRGVIPNHVVNRVLSPTPISPVRQFKPYMPYDKSLTETSAQGKIIRCFVDS